MGRPIIIKDSYRIFDEIDSEQAAYWLGFLSADGMVRSWGYETTLNLGIKDEEHLCRFASMFNVPIKPRYSHHKKTGKTYETRYCSVFSKYLYEALVNKGIYPNKTKLDNADVISRCPERFLSHLVRGIFDGDGTICTAGSSNRYYFGLLGCETLLLEIRNCMVEELDISPNTIQSCRGTSRVAWQGRFQLLKIREWLYKDATIYLQRKYDRFFSIQDRALTSKFRGVSLNGRQWVANVGYGGKQYYLGSFGSEEEAAKAYDLVATEYRGEDARLNFPRIS